MAETLRLDKFLWYARIAKTRTLAQALAETGRFRLNRRVIERARRGPPAEARSHYCELTHAPDGD